MAGLYRSQVHYIRGCPPRHCSTSSRSVKHFAGLQSINILNYNGADTMEPHYLRRYPDLNPKSVGCTNRTFDCPGLVGITALNCSKAPGCKLSGLTILTAL